MIKMKISITIKKIKFIIFTVILSKKSIKLMRINSIIKCN